MCRFTLAFGVCSESSGKMLQARQAKINVGLSEFSFLIVRPHFIVKLFVPEILSLNKLFSSVYLAIKGREILSDHEIHLKVSYTYLLCYLEASFSFTIYLSPNVSYRVLSCDILHRFWKFQSNRGITCCG